MDEIKYSRGGGTSSPLRSFGDLNGKLHIDQVIKSSMSADSACQAWLTGLSGYSKLSNLTGLGRLKNLDSNKATK